MTSKEIVQPPAKLPFEVRDIGAKNQYSIKDGHIFHKPSHLYIFLFLGHLQNFDYFYRATPRKFKIHRSMHSTAFFCASVYLPYRFSA